MKHIFLTGEKQVGKSYVINKVCESLKGKYFGVKSISKFNDYGQKEVFLTDISKNDEKLNEFNLAGRCINYQVIEVNVEVFDKYGVSLLENKDNKKIAIIDEIGQIEKDARIYGNKIRKIIENEDIKLIGVLRKDADTELANFIRNNKDVGLLEVTKNNQCEIMDTIKEFLGKFL